MSRHALEESMVPDRLLDEIKRQQKYLDRLPQDFNFPLFNAKTAVESQRRSGYRNTASAARELVDNAIEAGAHHIDVVFERAKPGKGQRADSVSSVAFIDDGAGMTPMMARFALTWGGGTHFDEPDFIGKFGFGLPNASINQTRRVEVYARAKAAKKTFMAWLDIHEIDEFGVTTVVEPVEAQVPDFVKKYLEATGRSFDHGTVVVWVKPDRLTYRSGAQLKEHLLDDFGVTYRYLLDDLDLRVDGVRVEMVDPLFLDSKSRYFVPSDQGGARLTDERVIPVRYFRDKDTGELRLSKIEDASELSTKDPDLIAAGKVALKIARLPYGFAVYKKGKKETDGHHRFDIRQSRRGMTFVRAGREIETVDAFPRSKRDIASGLGSWPLLQSYAYHWGIEVKFDPALDEVFGITNDKQRVRPIEDFWRLLSTEEIDRLLREENRWQSTERAAAQQPKAEPSPEPTPGETAAAAANTIAGRPSRIPEHYKPKARKKLEDKAAARSKVTQESIDEAIDALEQESKRRPYRVDYIDDSRAPFFEPTWEGAQVVVRVNRAHPFYQTLYADLLRLKGGLRAKEAIDVLLIALGRAELTTEDETAKLWYERQRTDIWSPFLADALRVLSQSLRPTDEEPEEGSEAA
jgi:hypothetical protein